MVGEAEAARKSFFVVYVPADVETPLEEWSVALPDDKEQQIGCLTDRLRLHFKSHASHGAVMDDAQKDVFKQQLMSQLPAGTSMDDSMLQMMLQVQTHVSRLV